jgi:TonB family protein
MTPAADAHVGPSKAEPAMRKTLGLCGVASSIACRAILSAGFVTLFWAAAAPAQAGDVFPATAVQQPAAPVKQDAAPLQPTGLTNPTVIREVRPNYTFDAMRANIEGVVVVECVVTRDGTVGDVRVVRSLDRTFGLDEEAVKAARQWLFRPGTRNGEPIPVLISIELSFRIKGTPPLIDSPVPLSWPEAFGTPGDSDSVRNAAPERNGWTVVRHELPDLRFRIAYPMEWKQIGSFATGPLMLGDRQDTALLIVHLETRDVSPTLSEPVGRVRLQQFTGEMIQSLGQSDLTRNAQFQPAGEGQVRLSNRIWIWTDLLISDFARLPFDRARWWRFMTLTGARRVLVDCLVGHQRGTTEDFTALARSAGSTCAQILTQVSIEAP